MDIINKRIAEAYVGEYASGKSELAVNRALELVKNGKVTIADLDTVEPCYTLRPIKKQLEEKGLHVIAWETADTIGLGEAGSVIKGAMRWVLRNKGDIVMDIGYGAQGSDILNIIEGADEDPDLKVICVINMSRPFTATVQRITEYIGGVGRVDAVINNTHLDEETTAELVQKGARGVCEAAKMLNVEYLGTAAVTAIATEIGVQDCMGFPVRVIERYMPKTFW